MRKREASSKDSDCPERERRDKTEYNLTNSEAKVKPLGSENLPGGMKQPPGDLDKLGKNAASAAMIDSRATGAANTNENECQKELTAS